MAQHVVKSKSWVSCNYAEIHEYRSAHWCCQDVGSILLVLRARGHKNNVLTVNTTAQTRAYFVCVFMRQSNI